MAPLASALLLVLCTLANAEVKLDSSKSNLNETELFATLVEEMQSQREYCLLMLGHDYIVLPHPIQRILQRIQDQSSVLSLQWTTSTPRPPPNRGPPDEDFEYWFSWLSRRTAKPLSNCALVVLLLQSADHFQPLLEFMASKVVLNTNKDRFLYWSSQPDVVRAAMMSPESQLLLFQMGVEQGDEDHMVLLNNCHFCLRGEPDVVTRGEYYRGFGLLPQNLELYPDFSRNMHGKHLNASFPFDITPSEIKYMVDSFLPMFPFLMYFVDLGDAINLAWHMEMPEEEEGVDAEMELPDGNWTGMIGTVLRREKDFCGGKSSDSIMKVMDLMDPHVISYMSFVRRTSRPLFSWRAVVEPYTPRMWVLIFASSVVSSLVFFLLLAVLVGASNPFSPERPPRSLVFYSFGYVFSALLRESPRTVPSASSARVFILFWWLFVTVIVCGFEAKFIGFLAKPDLEVLPGNFREMLAHPKWQWGIVNFIKPFYKYLVAESEIEYHHALTPKLQDGGDMTECMSRALKEDFSCLGITELLVAMSFQYMDLEGHFPSVIADETSLLVVGGMMARKHSLYTPIANRMVQYSSQAGFYVKYESYFKYTCILMGMKDARKENRLYKYSMSLRFSQMKGPFVFTSLALATSFLCFLYEIAHFRYSNRNTHGKY